jgi:uncharacterized membrane protein YfcA
MNKDITPANFDQKDDADFRWKVIGYDDQRELNWLKIEFENIPADEYYLVIPASRFAFKILSKNERHRPYSGKFMEIFKRSYRSNPYIIQVQPGKNDYYVYFEEGYMHHAFPFSRIGIGKKQEVEEYGLRLNRKKLIHDQFFFYQAINLFIIGFFSVVFFIFLHRKYYALLFFGLMLLTSGIFHLRVSAFTTYLNDARFSKWIVFFIVVNFSYLCFLLYINTFYKIKYKKINIILFVLAQVAAGAGFLHNIPENYSRLLFASVLIIIPFQVAHSLKNDHRFDKSTKVVLLSGVVIHSGAIIFDWLFKILFLHKFLSPISIGMNAMSLSMIYFFVKMYKKEKIELQKSKTELIELQKENIAAELESLKQQIDPHFLFNSLGALMSLIEESKESAQAFVEELSKVYRYILKVKDKNIIELYREIEFAESLVSF